MATLSPLSGLRPMASRNLVLVADLNAALVPITTTL